MNLNGFRFCLLSGDQEGRLDLSHPVHVDNCLLEPDTRKCWREQPAFIHRELRYMSMTAEGKGEGNHSRAAAATRLSVSNMHACLGRSGVTNVDLQVFLPLAVLFSTSTTTSMEETCSSPAGMQRQSR